MHCYVQPMQSGAAYAMCVFLYQVLILFSQQEPHLPGWGKVLYSSWTFIYHKERLGKQEVGKRATLKIIVGKSKIV